MIEVARILVDRSVTIEENGCSFRGGRGRHDGKIALSRSRRYYSDMNPWTGLFQSVHSALIDELTERHPEPKPELGMPVREASYRIPDPALSSILVCGVDLSEQRGVLLLASDPG